MRAGRVGLGSRYAQVGMNLLLCLPLFFAVSLVWTFHEFHFSQVAAPCSAFRLVPELPSFGESCDAWEQEKEPERTLEIPQVSWSTFAVQGRTCLLHFQGGAGGSVCFGLSGVGHISFPGLFTFVWSFCPDYK